MKDIKSILSFYKTPSFLNQKAAIAQVVRLEESSYRREGARMLVFESGVFEGGISGGCLEGDTLKRSLIAIMKNKPSIVTYDTSTKSDNKIGVGLGCNGIIDVLISPLTMESEIINQLEKINSSRKSHILVTILSDMNKFKGCSLGNVYYYEENYNLSKLVDKRIKTLILNDIKLVEKNKKSTFFTKELDENKLKYFIEYIPTQIHVSIYGDNYDVYSMINILKPLDWDISLVGNINKFKKEKVNHIRHVYEKTETKRPNNDERTAVLLMAHDFKSDLDNLKIVLKTKASYIGVLGPKKRFIKMLDKLNSENIFLSKNDLSRIYAPCGLEIGANTPEEIASSICSEIIAVFSNKKGGMLKNKKGPIHDRF